MASEVKSWTEQLGYYDDPEVQFIRCMVYGEMGCGKTTFAASFPDPFFIDTDKGGLTLRDKKIPFIKLSEGNKTWREVMSILEDLKEKKPPFDKLQVKTLVIDGFTNLADFLLTDIMKYPRDPKKLSRDLTKVKAEWDDYSILGAELRTLTSFVQDLPMNVVGTCGVKLEKDEVRGTYIGQPNIVGGFRNVVGHKFDEVYYMEVKRSGQDVRYQTHFQKSSYFAAKSRMGLTGSAEAATYKSIFSRSA